MVVKKYITIRIEKTIYDKLLYITKCECRSVSSQAAHMISQYIRDFEKENGKININDAN